MITAHKAAIAPALFCLTLVIFTPERSWGENAPLQTAAEMDWRLAPELDPATRASLPWFCSGAYVQPGITDVDPDTTVMHTTSDSLQHEEGNRTILIGDVQMRQGNRRILTPRAEIEERSEIANIAGPLVIREKGLLITGETATSNLFSGTGVINHATFLMHTSGFSGSAERIRRKANLDLILTNSIFTRCDPTSRAWSMKGGTLILEETSGFGTARNVTLRIRDVPVVWIPWIRFPITDERQTGFLMPSGGYSSSDGTEIVIPYYFNIAPEMDLTYRMKSLWKRGIVHEGEYRFLAGRSTNQVNLGYIRKDQLFGGETIVDGATGNSVTLPPIQEQDRWFFNARHDGGWDSRWKSSVNYSAVSDNQYLQDIGGDFGVSSLDQYVNTIDQSLTSRRAPALERKGQVQYRGEGWNSSLTLLGFQKLDDLQPEQYEMLPQLSTNVGHRFGPANFSMGVDLTSFYKDNTGLSGVDAIVGERAVFDTTVSIRKSNIWGYIEPSLGVIHRMYDLDDTPVSARSTPQVTTPRLALDTGLIFDRFFSASLFSGEKEWLQTLEPRAYLLYVEADYQDDLPGFDASPLTPGYQQLFRNNRFSGYDRIGDTQQVSLGVTSRLLERMTGSQYITTSIGQIFYLKDREVIYRPNGAEDPTAKESPLFVEARFTLPMGLNFAGTYEWEPDVNRSNRGSVSVKYVSGDRKIFNLNYVYTSPLVQPSSSVQSEEESDLSLIWPIMGRWSAIGRWNFSWDRHQTIESFAGVEFNDCCWKARVVVRRFLKEPEDFTVIIADPTSSTGFRTETRTDFPADTGIFFEFQLKGLSTLGGRLDSLLEQAIPGYRNRENRIGN